ncbi:MAG: DUF6850 family outer membrane beta-barrel protein [Butyricimonas faecihominis]
MHAGLKRFVTVGNQNELVQREYFTENVLNPDLKYFDAKTLDTKIDVQYSFPMKLKKTSLTGYVKAYAGNIFTDKFGSRFNGGISIGILTL